MWIMSILYMVLEFEPTTFGTWVASNNHYTRAPTHNLFKCQFRYTVVGRTFVHSLVHSLGQIHRGLDGYFVKK